MDRTLGWYVTDPDGTVVDAGEVTIVEVDLLDEIREYLTDQQPEGA
jgi:hypothetical protein